MPTTYRASKTTAIHTVTAMISEFKLPMYLSPAQNPCETVHGGIEFTGKHRLTVRMRDFLDVVFTFGRTIIDIKGRLVVVFDAAEVSRTMHQPRPANKNRKEKNLGNGLTTPQGIGDLRRLIEGIKAVSLCQREPNSDWGLNFGIIDEWGDTKTDAPRLPGQFGARAFTALGSKNKPIVQSVKLKKIVFTIRYTDHFLTQLQICINKSVILKVLSLKHLFTRSVARLFFSHSNDTSCGLIKALSQMGIEDPYPNADGSHSEYFKRLLRRYRQYLQEDAPTLQELSFYSNDSWNTINYRRNSGVFISDPKKIMAVTNSPGEAPVSEVKLDQAVTDSPGSVTDSPGVVTDSPGVVTDSPGA